MGTRSTVKFISEHDQETVLLSIYQQYDGYIDGVGRQLAEFLKDKKVINGFNSSQTMETGYANGMGCLAAQYLASIKTGVGGVYCTGPDDKQQYNYRVSLVGENLIVEVDDLFK